MSKVFFLLPAYNEEDSVDTVVSKIDEVCRANGIPYEINAMNDGSVDATLEKLRALQTRYPIEILTHNINRGLGETIRDLFERAASVAADDDVIVRLDCDDSHEAKFIPQMLAKLDEGYDVVIASRFQPGGGQKGVNTYRTAISYGANAFMKLFFPMKGVRDYSSGYRAYRASFIRQAIGYYGNRFIQLKELGFACTLEKLVKLNLIGARFAEVPFVLRYDQKVSASKMVTSVTTLGYIVLLILHWWPWGGWRWNDPKRWAEQPVNPRSVHFLEAAAANQQAKAERQDSPQVTV